MADKLIHIDDAAVLAGLSTKYIRRLVRQKHIEVTRRGREIYLTWDLVKRLALEYQALFSLLQYEDLNADSLPDALVSRHREYGEPEKVDFPVNRIVLGNCVEVMLEMPSNIVQTVVTSPPYWGIRRYDGNQEIEWATGTVAAFGTEPTPEEYVRHTLEILLRLKRILRDDGVIWWNVGDTYVTRAVVRKSTVERLDAFEGRRQDTWREYPVRRYSSGQPYLKDKDLSLVPFHIAIGAQRLGYWVRSIIVWSKENTMPEPVQDRPTTSHEYIIQLAKSRFYYYDKEAAREQAQTESIVRNGSEINAIDTRNLRTVWHFAVSSSHGDHTAAFPLELPLRCIRASTRPGDLVFDPFMGSGTTAVAADRLGRAFFGCDISSEYVEMARQRLEQDRRRRGAEQEETVEGDEVSNEDGDEQAIQPQLL